jgi:hypothetical protein
MLGLRLNLPIFFMSKNPAKKIINDPLKCADELFEGLILAYDGNNAQLTAGHCHPCSSTSVIEMKRPSCLRLSFLLM